MRKYLIFDMDGTIANLYGVEGWLSDLESSNPRPYVEATPFYDRDKLNTLLEILKDLGYEVIVASWLSKSGGRPYKKLVRRAKRQWLGKEQFPADEVHLVQYGTPKSTIVRDKDSIQILFDDDDKVRDQFENIEKQRYAINPKDGLLEYLTGLIHRELEDL